MELKDTIEEMRNLLTQIVEDLEKANNGNKAASQRVRTGTVKLEKVAKHYRKESIQDEKHTKGAKKESKKLVVKAKGKASTGKAASAAPSAPAKVAGKTQKTVVKAKSFLVKQSTAKLPIRKG